MEVINLDAQSNFRMEWYHVFIRYVVLSWASHPTPHRIFLAVGTYISRIVTSGYQLQIIWISRCKFQHCSWDAKIIKSHDRKWSFLLTLFQMLTQTHSTVFNILSHNGSSKSNLIVTYLFSYLVLITNLVICHPKVDEVTEDAQTVVVLGHLQLKNLITFAYRIKTSHALVRWNPPSIANKSHLTLWM